MKIIGRRAVFGSVVLSTWYTKAQNHWSRAPVCVDGAALLAARLDLDALAPGLHGVSGVDAIDNQIRVPVVVEVDRQRP